MSLASVSAAINAGLDRVRERPFTALLLTHVVTTSYFVWVYSEGRPLPLIKKLLFRAVLSAVPQGIVDAEQKKLKQKIESSVVGHAMDGVPTYTALPAVGLPKDAVVALLDTGCKRDRVKWDSGKVRRWGRRR